jgi:hypothetical protein
MGTLTEFREWLRLDLNDPAGAGQRFRDADLNRAVERAVAELSLALPKVSETVLLPPAATRHVPLPAASFPGLLDVVEVEYPYDVAGDGPWTPEAERRPAFRVSPDRQTLALLTAAAPASGEAVRVRWLAAHAIGEEDSSVPAELDHLVARGAYGFAALAYSTPAADNFKYEDGATVAQVDDSMIAKEWRARANEAIGEFRREIAKLEWRRSPARGLVAWDMAWDAVGGDEAGDGA